ncbi:hypothetical protein L1887_49567 [Cichorium endivia]|nr:hypothetical protein L1887_49567 [Cichorium endivia]
MDYNNMNDEEIVQKIKSGEIAYVGDHFINHNHNFNMTKAVAIANRNVGKDKVIVNKEIFKNLFGYDQISVHGVGFDMDAYYVIGVSNAIEATFESQGVNHEYLAHLEEQAAREAVEDTSFMIKVNGSDIWEEFDPEKFYGTEFNGGDNDICDEGLPF